MAGPSFPFAGGGPGDPGPLSERGAKSREWFSLAEAFARAIEARDPYTAGHLWRVSTYGELLTREIGGAAEEVEDASLGGLLHDIGKVAIPDAILMKPGRLTEEETRIMQTHAERGADIVRSSPPLARIEPFVRDHHERLDGSGYPRGMKGDEVGWQARVLAVADSFDAMTSARPYRGPGDSEVALRELQADAGRTYDGDAVAALLRLADQGIVTAIVLHSGPGLALAACLRHGPIVEMTPGCQEGDHVHCPLCPDELHLVFHDNRPVAVPAR